jgi:lipopolysaccharide biosynthesis glycosyltransferase
MDSASDSAVAWRSNGEPLYRALGVDRRAVDVTPVVVFAGNDRFARPIAVAISSAARASSSPLQFIVIDCGLEDESREFLTAAAQDVTIAELPLEWLDRLPHDKFPRAFYARLFIERVVPESAERIVYLDGDVLVRGSLHPLFELDLGGSTVAAAPISGIGGGPNPPTAGGPARIGWRKDEVSWAQTVWSRCGVPPAALLFNSGLLVVDLDRWRERSVLERLLEVADRVEANDQTYLNIVLWNDWMPLDARWNSKVADAHIYHFAGPRKPWRDNYYESSIAVEYAEAARCVGWDLKLDAWTRTKVRARAYAKQLTPPVVSTARRRRRT